MNARQQARALEDAARFDWPEIPHLMPITVKVADVTDEEQFPNIARAIREARDKGDE